MQQNKIANVILRIGVAFAFLYPPINALYNPDSWIGYFPTFMHQLVPNDTLLLHGFGVIEVVIALWILSGWRITLPALGATVMLLLIVFLNWSQFEVVFRDLSIAAASLALAIDAWAHNRQDQRYTIHT